MSRLMPNVRTVRRGLTLVEVLVSFLLLAIIGGALTRVMMKQQQFYKDASLTAKAKRELRLGASVLPAELRSISSSGGDILKMAEYGAELRAYTGTSIICARTTDDIWVPPTNLARHTLTTYVTRPEIGDTVFIFNENTGTGSQDDQWEQRWITAIDANASACNGPPFTDPALDPSATKKRSRYHLNAALPPEVQIGAVVRFTRPVRYGLYQESSGLSYLGIEEYVSGSWSS
ncbi:MAG: PilW family protein, partial [Vicinamibacterales bacterium]